MSKTICYYHDDMDGYASAAIVKKVYPAAEFVKVNYGDKIENITKFDKETIVTLDKETIVIIVDFSFSEGTMDKLVDMKLEGEIKNLIWIDHHKSAKEKMPDLWNIDSVRIEGLRETDKGSAAVLTWKWFHPDKKVPKALDYISRYDTWDFGNNEREIKAFIEGLNNTVGSNSPIEYDSYCFHSLLYNPETSLFCWTIERGNLLLSATMQRVDKSISNGIKIIFHEHKALLVNSNYDISLIGEKIYSSDYDVGIIWFVRKDRVIFSLRSKTVDVSKIAMKYGGGGHKEAAGFWFPIKHQVNITGFDFLNDLAKEEI